MPDLLIFAGVALAAVWATGRLDQAATTIAVLLAWRGLDAHDWIGWSWSWQQAGWYAVLAVVMIFLLSRAYDKEIEQHETERKPVLDYLALGAWGVVQQGVLLGYLAEEHRVAGVLVFALVHLPNPLLTVVTLVGGAASVAIASHFGEPSILVAGASHAVMSVYLRDVIGADMGVGRSYLVQRLRIL